MAFSLKGIRLPHRKNADKLPPVRIAPKTVTIPMDMHIGRSAIPTVGVGDEVKVGTLIGKADGNISSNIYSSVSGKVVKFVDYLLFNGAATTAVVIESDGAMEIDQTITPPIVNTSEEFVEALKESGIVGLGGAGFPTHVKFAVDPEKIEYIIINGAECEPYVTSDTVTMTTRSDDMAFALKNIGRIFGNKKVIIGIESNKKDAIACMSDMAASISECSVSVKVLPPFYPQGGEKVLIYNTTGRKIPKNTLPIDAGCLLINCTTLAAIGAYLKTGIPLVEKCVTIDGGAVKTPQNVIAPIGTSISDMFDFCGGLTEEPAKIIYGGPMMGVTVPGTNCSVLKNSNAILALTYTEAKLPKTTACLRCGACLNTCPFGLAPVALSKAYDNRSVEDLTELSIEMCMECGCCSYICPANRPLVQKNKLAKQFIREERMKEVNK